MRLHRLRTPFLLSLAMGIAAVGCQHRVGGPPRAVRIAILPFTAPETITERPYDIRGWWFGSHDVRQSGNVGAWTAESLGRVLAEEHNLEIVPHYDLRRYLLEQRRTLRDAYPEMTDGQIDALLSEVPLADYGRDLQVDKIITGQVYLAQLSHNRTIDTWRSRVDYQIQVWDVNTLTEASENGTPETPEYVDRVEEGEWFSSWLAAADEVSRTIAKRLARDYFRDASHFQNL